MARVMPGRPREQVTAVRVGNSDAEDLVTNEEQYHWGVDFLLTSLGLDENDVAVDLGK